MQQAIAEHLRQRPELLPTLLTTLFEIVLFDDCTNQWSLSRPMLSLILVNEQARSIIHHPPPKLLFPLDMSPWVNADPSTLPKVSAVKQASEPSLLAEELVSFTTILC